MSLEPPPPGAVHLYEFDLDSFQFTDVLSEDERARAARFRFDRDRQRYTAGRCALRCLLSTYLKKEPRSIAFSYGFAGKPSVSGISFNLAHSGSHAVIAIAANARVGVDIEEVREFSDMDDVAKSVFSSGELQRWRSAPEDRRADYFYRLWTRKEAYLKAIGEGIAQRLQALEVSLGDPAEIIAGAEGAWALQDISHNSQLIGALAFEGPEVTIHSFELGAA